MKQTPTLAWLQVFPRLQDIDDPGFKAVTTAADFIHFPAGSSVFRDGTECNQYLLVLEGTIRVEKTTASGNEIVLNHVEPGQPCELTTSCLLTDKCYMADAVTESDVRVVSIPRQAFEQALAESPGFRRFVFSSITEGMNDLIELVEEVAFGHVDCRLAGCLLHHTHGGHTVQATHQHLAAELGTAREVISRVLKTFEQRGWVRLGRGQVELIDEEALARLTQQDTV